MVFCYNSVNNKWRHSFIMKIKHVKQSINFAQWKCCISNSRVSALYNHIYLELVLVLTRKAHIIQKDVLETLPLQIP